jgi:hypothetical protein
MNTTAHQGARPREGIWQTIAGNDPFAQEVNFTALDFPFVDEEAIGTAIETTSQTVLSPVLDSSMFVQAQDVVHSVNNVVDHHLEEAASSSLVAVLTAFVPWKETLENMLRDGVDGIKNRLAGLLLQ